jgi:quercetin dioxygenase-like cupin family protein
LVEKTFKITIGNERNIEKVIQDENIHYIHMVFGKDEGLPEHFSNSTVYMTVVRGILSVSLDEQEIHKYQAGTVLKIPFQTKMNVSNKDVDVLELIVVKAPAPINI